jgi:putative colanic acid biosynthesis UDP-glucose lipid carrier transferase
MKVNADSDSKQATKNDPRITRLGAFLRKSSIDELPQFFNVFIGNMSVIGPRPHMLKHTEEYAILIEKFMGRHYVKPGITGLAQCMGYRGETQTVGDMENRVRLDRYYIENWTFWLDIKIIFLTIISLIRGSDKAF